MKKVIIILALSCILFLTGTKTVTAQTAQFYEGEYIDNIYLVRFDGTTKYYQKARFFRRTNDDKAAYCLQPFVTFDPTNNSYIGKETPENMDQKTKERVTDLAAFGYGYSDHTDPKWYALTQLLIWKTMEPQNDFYFTDGLNGKRIDPYHSEIIQLETIIKDSRRMPSINQNTYHGIVGQTLKIHDNNEVLKFFGLTSNLPDNITFKGNDLTVKGNKEGCFEQGFKSYDNDGSNNILFYYNGENQQLMTIGSPNIRYATVNFCFYQPEITIEKIDQDTKTITSPGEASLKGTIFTLYNDQKQKITDVALNANMTAKIIGTGEQPLISFGTYYLQETTTGIGYQPNNKTYTINITKETPKTHLQVSNEVIKQKVVIEKSYGNHQVMTAEANITFAIYNQQQQLINKITTDKNGQAEIILPYGHYIIEQLTTTEGYTKTKPFNIFIESMDKNYHYKVYDYQEQKKIIEVPVPNTASHSKKASYFSLLELCLALGGFYVKNKMA